MMTKAIAVETYSLKHANGSHLRKATRVIVDGQRIDFMELVPKRLAVPQALALLANGYPAK